VRWHNLARNALATAGKLVRVTKLESRKSAAARLISSHPDPENQMKSC
jgi:hypothetical protein